MFLKTTPVDVCVSPALHHFSDSILEYLANLDKAPDPTVRKDTFSSEIYAAFDILFNNWLQSRESKVRAAIRLSNWVSCVLQLKDHDAFQLYYRKKGTQIEFYSNHWNSCCGSFPLVAIKNLFYRHRH